METDTGSDEFLARWWTQANVLYQGVECVPQDSEEATAVVVFKVGIEGTDEINEIVWHPKEARAVAAELLRAAAAAEEYVAE